MTPVQLDRCQPGFVAYGFVFDWKVSMRLEGQLIRRAQLGPTDQAEMFRLMDRHYAGVRRDVFESDLAEKTWVIQVRNVATGELCGFSTQMILNAALDGAPIKALFSGDTIIDPQYWGDHSLIQAGGRLAMSLIDDLPGVELYWFLISAGYKTYRFLPIFFREFFPRFDQAIPPRAQQVIDMLAGQKLPKGYDRATGVIRAGAGTYRLREGVADVTESRMQDPHVRFFVSRNPGHACGDELCCLARLSKANFTHAADRVLSRAVERDDARR